MNDERILEIIEKQDKFFILGFIKGLKENVNELQQENQQLKEDIKFCLPSNKTRNENFNR